MRVKVLIKYWDKLVSRLNFEKPDSALGKRFKEVDPVLRMRVCYSYLERCNENYKIAFSQWRSFFRQRYVKHNYLQDIITETKQRSLEMQKVQNLCFVHTRKRMKDFCIKNANQLTLRRLDDNFLPKGYLDQLLSISQIKRGGPVHLINTFNQISWTEPLDKNEIALDKEFMKTLKAKRKKEEEEF